MLLDEQIVALEGAFVEARVPHAFGGAQALAYYGSIRATHDIDVNVFVPTAHAERVLGILGALGARVDAPELLPRIRRDGQARVRWAGTPVDVFFAYDPLHESCLQRRRRVDFYGDPIHILSAEDLVIFKAVFDREKDWQDIAGIVYASPDPLDLDYVRGFLARIDTEAGPRLRRLEVIVESGGEDLGR